jgi:hypothetical protein
MIMYPAVVFQLIVPCVALFGCSSCMCNKQRPRAALALDACAIASASEHGGARHVLYCMKNMNRRGAKTERFYLFFASLRLCGFICSILFFSGSVRRNRRRPKPHFSPAHNGCFIYCICAFLLQAATVMHLVLCINPILVGL